MSVTRRSSPDTVDPAPPAGGGLAGTSPRAAAAELGAAFKGCLASVRRLRGRETRGRDGLSDAQYGLLFGLREHAELPSSELASLADLSPATATQMLDSLAAGGLVARVRSERDRRVVLTSLTERGHALLEARHAELLPRWEAALAPFSDDELRTAAAVLGRLHVMFDGVQSGP